MHDLELVGVHDDGEHVVLAGADGSRYLLRIDEPLRAAVRRDRARLGQLQIAIDGTLRPRDIQARIRAGQSAESIAEAAGLPLEHVRRYEGPVLAEREEVVRRARNTVGSRGQGGDQLLDDLVTERMTVRGVGGDRRWDAWREDMGTWVVQVAFTAAGRAKVAQWRYEPTARTVDPLDDEARWLSGRASQDNGPLSGRRLSAVRGQQVSERVYDVEADGGVRESETDSDSDSEPTVPRTVDILDALRGRRGRRQPVLDEDADPDEADLVDELLERGDAPAAHPPASRPHEATDAEVLALPQPPAAEGDAAQAPTRRAATKASRSTAGTSKAGTSKAGTSTASPSDGPTASDSTADGSTSVPGVAQQGSEPVDVRDNSDADPQAPAAAARPARRHSRSKRASVPSWDDIVFGAKKD